MIPCEFGQIVPRKEMYKYPNNCLWVWQTIWAWVFFDLVLFPLSKYPDIDFLSKRIFDDYLQIDVFISLSIALSKQCPLLISSKAMSSTTTYK